MKPFRIRAVLFDFDGTLTLPGALDFAHIKATIGCPKDQAVLEFIDSLEDPEARHAAHRALDRFEMDGARESAPHNGAEDLIEHLKTKGLRLGIISRNRRKAIDRALANFSRVRASDFDIIISRDDPIRPKPSGDGIRMAAEKLQVCPEEIMMVGDFAFDIEAGNRAGAVTVLLKNTAESAASPVRADFTISSLEDLPGIVRMGLPLPAGKFPNDLLDEFLHEFEFDDPSVLIASGIGEDTAAVNVDGEEVLILKSDPITFATDAIGHYAVLVNANDIATAGAIPRWFLTTLLFPCGITPSGIRQVMNDLKTICEKWDITLCGGHTEITDAVTRPVVIGMMAGTVPRARLIDKRDMRTGDVVFLTKQVAVEGTAIIAREFDRRLVSLGVSETDIRTCKDFLSMISILPEARIARDCPGVSAMHDVTEGGVATALKELSIAGGHRLRIDLERIPIYPQTRQISRLLGIDPLGLIGSGSLLICCRADESDTLAGQLAQAGIPCARIGKVTSSGQGIEAMKAKERTDWPEFEVDEITRLF